MPIRALVVDDSAFMRQAISKMLESERGIAVCGTARSGEEAVRLAQQLKPDVVTMDVEMPGMGGLQAVREIASASEIPVIMVSALTQEGAETTFRALEAGAVDFIAKPDAAYVNIQDVARDLIAKVRAFAAPRIRRRPSAPAFPPAVAPIAFDTRMERLYQCVAIGTSTGGPVALSKILPALPLGFTAPIIVVQHMPPGFTRPLAERLNATSRIEVLEAQEGMVLTKGCAYVAPAGSHLSVTRTRGDEVQISLSHERGTWTHAPSVDYTVGFVADVYQAAGLGVILTGMGADGVAGLRRLKERGGYVIGQDEASSVVYGMPRAAANAGVVDIVMPLDRIPSALCELTNSSFARS